MGNKPLRCFEGTAKPHEPFWRIRNEAGEGGQPEIELYGWISEISWMDDEITPKMFKDDLYKAGMGGPITIRLNSAGGDVIAASVMRSIIMDYPGKVTVRIDGLAASAATVVATAGDRVLMQDSAYFMIHDPLMVFFMAALNIEDLKRITDTLKSVKDGILQAYAAKSGLSREKLSRMMTDETWMSAAEAKAAGFVDEIVTWVSGESGAKNARKAALLNAAQIYNRVPDGLMGEIDPDPDGEGAEEKVGKVVESDVPGTVSASEEGNDAAAGSGADPLDATARRLRAECSILRQAKEA